MVAYSIEWGFWWWQPESTPHRRTEPRHGCEAEQGDRRENHEHKQEDYGTLGAIVLDGRPAKDWAKRDGPIASI